MVETQEELMSQAVKPESCQPPDSFPGRGQCFKLYRPSNDQVRPSHVVGRWSAVLKVHQFKY